MNALLALDGPWELAGFDGYGERIDARTLPAGMPNFQWIPATVPGSVYRDLARAGWLGDVHAGCNSLAAQWVERQYWYYRTRFRAPDGAAATRWWLVLAGLDLDALIFLNGGCIGAHHNFFRPCRIEVTTALVPGDNELLIRLDAGLLRAADRCGGDYHLEVTALESKRPHLRKPQFGARWDWAPRLLNVGIGGGAWLEGAERVRVDDWSVAPLCTADSAAFRARAWVDVLAASPQAVRLEIRDTASGDSAVSTSTLAGGTHLLEVELPRPLGERWWPQPLGAPRLHELELILRVDGAVCATHRLRSGLRHVALHQPPDAEGSRFVLHVNDQPVFCKGANWVPPDLLYTAVTADDYRALVALAVEQHMNLLRIWGGGLYADPQLLTACDEAGILVWHDFMFACSRYPADDPEFLREVDAETRYQLRRLAHHPSLAVWCGNNEIEVGVADRWIECHNPEKPRDRSYFFEHLAQLVDAEDGTRPYWPTSPWSPDGRPPNDPASGDQHPWFVSLGTAKGDYWAYRADTSRFPNEGGMLGPSTPATLADILPPGERSLTSRTWRHHDNTQNTWRGEPLLDHLLRVNLVAEPRALSFDDYVRYAGLLHGEALATAIDTWRARKFATAAAIFWMFNDAWPAVVSWTPFDYFRRRKPAFWYVRRAFAPLRALCVERDGRVEIRVINDRPQATPVAVRFGLFGFAGGRPIDERVEALAPANAAATIAALPLAEWDRRGVATHGAFALLDSPAGRDQHRLLRSRFREMAFSAPRIGWARTAEGLELASDAFAWGVELGGGGNVVPADNHFDLLPGIPYRVAWPEEAPPPTGVVAANPR